MVLTPRRYKARAPGKATGLSQAKLARLIDVPVTTLQNREQGRRELGGPARALLRALEKDPEHVLQALV